MDALEAIFTRRSIRKYTSQPIPEELIEQILKAAMYAPSADNQQPWHFVVIDDRHILDAITQFHPYAQMLKGAPLAIAVCGDRRGLIDEPFWVQDCSAATQNLLLAAHALGLGTVWIGVYPDETVLGKTQKILHLPEGVTPLCLVAVGYPAQKVAQPQRFDRSRIHRNTW